MNVASVLTALSIIAENFSGDIRLAWHDWKLKAAVCSYENIHSPCTVSDSATGKFLLPDNQKQWHPTAFADAGLPALAERYIRYNPWGGVVSLCHVHSKNGSSNSAELTNFIRSMSNDPRIWYSGIAEIHRYLAAWRRLKTSADCQIVSNCGAETLFLRANNCKLRLAPGESAKFSPDGNYSLQKPEPLSMPEPVITPRDRMIFFPDGSRKALGFSFDDGKAEDEKLAALLRKYNIHGTFHLIAIRTLAMSEKQLAWYSSHEISTHGLRHITASLLPKQQLLTDTIVARKILENLTGTIITGHAWPNGTDFGAPEYAWDILAAAGITYARGSKVTNSFKLPENLMLWEPTAKCKPEILADLAQKFLSQPDSGELKLCTVYGHSWELKDDISWQKLENFCAAFTSKKIWKATLADISRYIHAIRGLEWSPDKTSVYNPSSQPIFIGKNNALVQLLPGMTLTFVPDK